MLHGPPQLRAHLLASVNNGASFTDGNSVTPAQASSSPFGDDFGLDDDDLTRAQLVTPFVQSHV
jgi:hypothetical protein